MRINFVIKPEMIRSIALEFKNFVGCDSFSSSYGMPSESLIGREDQRQD